MIMKKIILLLFFLSMSFVSVGCDKGPTWTTIKTCNVLFWTLTEQDKKWIYEESWTRENVYRCGIFPNAVNKENNIDCSLQFYQDTFDNRIYFWTGRSILKPKVENNWDYILNFRFFLEKSSNMDNKELVVINVKKGNDIVLLDKMWIIDLVNNVSESIITWSDRIAIVNDLFSKMKFIDDNNKNCYSIYNIRWRLPMWSVFIHEGEEWTILYKKVIDKWYSVDYVIYVVWNNISRAIEYLNLFVSNTRINTEFYKETAEVKTTTKKTSDNTNVQIQSNDEDDIKNSVKNISPEIKSSICETRENVKNCSLGMDNCPTECR